MSDWVLYGATGYTGTLIAEEAVRRGHKPLLAGRSETKLRQLGQRLGLEHAAVPLEDRTALRKLLEGKGAVLHAAGPFVQTSAPMVEACLDVGTSYLDLTGELPVMQHIYAQDERAEARGVALIPAVGFDVVPTDCLAKYVAGQVPGATDLEIAYAAISQPSAGTSKSTVGIVQLGGLVRRNGKLVPLALGRGVRKVRLSRREAWVMPGPIGDLESAHRSTGIPNITTYMAINRRRARLLRVVWPWLALTFPLSRRLMKLGPVNRRLMAAAERSQGPDATLRKTGHSYIWAQARSAETRKEAWLECSEAYAYTAVVALLAVERTLASRPVGALTPAQAFGADFALEVPGTRRLDRLA